MTEGSPINHEQALSPEVEKPLYDALLVHGYWMTDKTIKSRQKDGTISERHITAPALRTHFAARATALAWDNGKGAGKIVIDLGHFWGPNYPSEGKIMADTLINKYHVPANAIILKEDAYSTYGEIGSFFELAKQNDWINLLDIAFGTHRKTIERIYEGKDYHDMRRGLNIKYKSVEEILSKDNVKIRRKLSGLKRSRYEWNFKAYEALKWTKMHFPGFDYKKIEQANKDTRINPTEAWIPPVIGRIPGIARATRIDKYKLPPKTV